CDFGPAEIIIEGVNGYLVPQDDIPALAQALLRALDTAWDAEQIKATASRFALETMVQAKLELIQHLCPTN
ncbi:MAG: glycosyl transferase, partial [Cyanobacteria bacterium M5B4]